VSAGLSGCDDRPTPNTSAQDVLNIIMLYYIAALLRRDRGVQCA